MTDVVQLAKFAREQLAAALNALQTSGDLPDDLMEVADPIAEAMSVFHRIERTNGAQLDGRAEAHQNVRSALDRLQAIELVHPAVDAVMEAVAASLTKARALAKYQPPEPAPAPAPAVAAPAPMPAPVPAPPVEMAAPVPAPPVEMAAPVPAPPVEMPAPAPQPIAPQPIAPQPIAVAAPAPQPVIPAPRLVPVPEPAPAPVPAPAPKLIPIPDPEPRLVPIPEPHPELQPAPAPYTAPAPYAAHEPATAMSPPVAYTPAPAAPEPYRPPAPAAPEPYRPPAPAAPDVVTPGKGPTVVVELGTRSSSNFYKGLAGNDVVEHGGVFVATYKVPKIGSTVSLHVLLPGNYEFRATGLVQWVREPRGSDTEPGFGARFIEITSEGRQLVYRYARNREPLFYDDL